MQVYYYLINLIFNYLPITFTWFYFETYVCVHYIKLTVKMDVDQCLRDNLILFRCFAKTSNFQSKLPIEIT